MKNLNEIKSKTEKHHNNSKIEKTASQNFNRNFIGYNLPRKKIFLRYGLAVVAVLVALLIKLVLNSLVANSQGASTPFITFFAAIMVAAWVGGFGPGLLGTFLSLILALFFFLFPTNSFSINSVEDGINLLVFLLDGVLISGLCEILERSLHSRENEINKRVSVQQELDLQRERFAVTLASIGDAVIATDQQGRVTFINDVASQLIGWSQSEVIGLGLNEVFNIINEKTRQPVESPVEKVLAKGGIVGLANHTILIAKDGSETAIDDSGAPIKDTKGNTIGVVLVFRDITERKIAEEERFQLLESEMKARREAEKVRDQIMLLQNLTAALSEALTSDQVAEIILQKGIAAVGAEVGIIAITSTTEGDAKIIRETGSNKVEYDVVNSTTRDTSLPIMEAIRTLQPVWFNSLKELQSKYPQIDSTLLPTSNGEARAYVPLVVEGSTLGAIGFRFKETFQFDAEQKALILTLAQLCAQALERTRLYELEQNSRLEAETSQKRLAFLAEASKELATSLDTKIILQSVAKLTVPEFADWCTIDLLDEAGKKFQRAIAIHEDPDKKNLLVELEKLFPSTPTAQTGYPKVIQTSKAELYSLVSKDQFSEIVGNIEQLSIFEQLGVISFICVPLISRNQVLGAVSFATDNMSGRHFGSTDLQTAEEIARRVVTALDNSHLYKEEQVSRLVAEEAKQNLAFLVKANEILTSSLDYEQTLAKLAKFTVPYLCDYCIVDVVEEDQHVSQEISPRTYPRLKREAVAHFNPDKERMMQDILMRYPPDTDTNWGTAGVLHTGEPSFFAEIEDDVLVTAAQSEEHLKALRELGAKSGISVPIVHMGKTLGVLTLAFAESGRQYNQTGLAFVQDLARRAAIAIDNARLYRLAQKAQERQTYLAETSKVLASSLDYEKTLKSVAQLSVPHLADWCSVHIIVEGRIEPYQLAVEHVDPEKVRWAKDLQKKMEVRYPYDPNASSGLPKVLRTGEPELYPYISDEMLVAASTDEELLGILREIGYSSAMIVPLVARERVVGAIQFVATKESNRHYNAADLALGMELASRAAVAIDNARLYREAKIAIEDREEFLSVAAHELKTPLTGLRGFTQLLERQLNKGSIDRETVDRSIKIILQQSSKLTQLISQLLDVSRIEAGKLILEPKNTDLVKLVEGVVNVAQTNTNKHTITVLPTASEELIVYLDPFRFEQVVTNLVDNAVKYSPEGGPITIELSCFNSEDAREMVQLAVTDCGLGIPLEHRSHIFDRFYQAHERANLGGMGLGLHITRQIVELHGGNIRIEAPEEGGTRFIVTIPVHPGKHIS